MINKVFATQIDKNMEVSVDNMIVKNIAEEQHHMSDLKECFNNLRKNNMRLNPAKCTFELGAGKFLGYLVSRRAI